MPHRSSMLTTSIAALALAASSPVSAQQKGGKHHTLAATLDTVQWGWLDPNEPPKLKVNSGDTISIETMMHSHDKIKPGVTMDEIIALRKANPGGAGLDAAPVEERLEHGHQRAAGRLDRLLPGVPEGRPHLDRRLALPPGQRRSEPHRARVLLQGDSDSADRAQGHEARVAAHRDADP